MSSLPFISVVVPTFNRVHILPRLLAALEEQNFPSDRYEILIVDDGSSDGTWDYLSSLDNSLIRAFNRGHGGASRARNLGAANAQGEILAFTDDDCIPAPNWLRAISESRNQCGANTAFLGHTYNKDPASRFVHSVYKDFEPVTCNFAVPRRVFQNVGGFDPHFILYSGDEDLETPRAQKRRCDSACA
jgi:glycosyltransferase involved in cell wall biosynthesis